ncbi:hypothetical protein, partial [Oryzihumus sp.]|uniref:beta strand repeat-containing protein n=1 Tax=Oryzihumus sp. TaxID=1968903 RepID=UPI002EDAC84D
MIANANPFAEIILDNATINAGAVTLTATANASPNTTGLIGLVNVDQVSSTCASNGTTYEGPCAHIALLHASGIVSTGAVSLSSTVTDTVTAVTNGTGNTDPTADAAVSISVINATAITQVSGTSYIQAQGTLTIAARNTTNVTSTGDATQATAGAGIAAATVNTTTRAFIDASGAQPTTGTSISITADTNDTAASSAKASPGGAKQNSSGHDPNTLTNGNANVQGDNGASGTSHSTSSQSIPVAAALAFTHLGDDTRAYVSGSNDLRAPGGSITIHASSVNSAPTVADGSTTSADSGSLSVGVAVAIEVASVTTRAYAADNSRLESPTITVEAPMPASGPATDAFSATATSGHGDASAFDLAGSLALVVLTIDREATLPDNAAVNTGYGSGGQGNLTLTTTSSATSEAKATAHANVFDPKAAGVISGNTITLPYKIKHTSTPLAEHDGLVYSNGGDTSIGGLVDGAKYYVINLNDSGAGEVFQLAATSTSTTALGLDPHTATGTQHSLKLDDGVDGTGIGASFAINIVNDTETAALGNNTTLTGAGNLTLNATTTNTMTTEAENGAEGSVAITPTVAVSISNVTTQTAIGTGSLLTLGGNLDLESNQTASVTTTAKGDTASSKAGIGASIAITSANHIVRAKTYRYLTTTGWIKFGAIGASTTDSESKASGAGADTASGDGSASNGDNSNVNGQADAQLGQANSTASHNGTGPSSDSSTPTASTADQGGSGSGGSSAVTVAASVSFNLVHAATDVGLPPDLTVTAGQGLTLSSAGNTDATAKADGEAATQGGSASIGAAVAINRVYETNTANLSAGDVTNSDGLTLSAIMNPTGSGITADSTHSFVAQAVSGAQGSSSANINGSLALNIIDVNTSAALLPGGNDLRGPPQVNLTNHGAVNMTGTSTVESTTDATPAKQVFDPKALGVVAGNTITLPEEITTDSGQPLKTGDQVTYRSGGGAAIGGLTDGQDYWAIVKSPGHIQLDGTSQADALSGSPTVITLDPTKATGTQHSLEMASTQSNFDPVGGVSSNTITLATPLLASDGNALKSGDKVTYENGGDKTSVGGLTNGKDYWAIVVDSTHIKLDDTSAEDAKATSPSHVVSLTALTSAQTNGKQHDIKLADSGGSVGIGASVAVNLVNDTTRTGTQASSGQSDAGNISGAGDIVLLSTTTDKMSSDAEGGAAGNVSIAASVAVSIPNVTTIASFAAAPTPGAIVASGKIDATATQTASLDSKAEGDFTTQKVGIGISVSVALPTDIVDASSARSLTATTGEISFQANGSSQTTGEAKAAGEGETGAGDGKNSSGGGGTNSPSSSETVNQKADNQLAGAESTQSSNTGRTSSTSSTPKATDSDQQDQGGSGATLSLAGAVAFNLVTTKSTASFADGTTINAGGAVTLKTSAHTTVDGVAAGDTKVSTSVGIGAGITINLVDITNRATTGGASVSANGIDVEAGMGSVQSYDPVWLCKSSGGCGLVDFGTELPSSPSSGDYFNLTQAVGSKSPGVYKYDGTNWNAQTLTQAGALPDSASTDTLYQVPTNAITAAATSGASEGSSVVIAGSFTMNIVHNHTEAVLAASAGGPITVAAATGNVTLQATNHELDYTNSKATVEGASEKNSGNSSSGGSGGSGGGGGGGGGGGSGGGSSSSSGGAVGVGASVALNILTDEVVRAEVEDTVALTGAANVDLESASSRTIETHVEAGASGAKDGISPAVALVVLNNDSSRARLGTSSTGVSATGTVTVHASHAADVGTEGSADAAGSSVAVGVDISINILLGWSTTAEIARNVTGTAVSAIADSEMNSTATSKASAKGADKSKESGADQKSNHEISNNPNTNNSSTGSANTVGTGSTSAGNNTSSSNSTASGQSGGKSGGQVGVAASISVNWVVVTNTAQIDPGLRVSATGGAILAGAHQQTNATAKAIGLAFNISDGGTQVAAAVGLNVPQITNTATVGAGAVLTSSGSGAGITVEATTPSGKENDFVVWGAAGAGGKNSASVAASVGVQVISLHSIASVGAGSQLSSAGDINVNANVPMGLQTLALSGSLSLQGTAVGGAIAVNVIQDVQDKAYVDSATPGGTPTCGTGGTTCLNAAGNIKVTANTTMVPLAPAGIPRIPADKLPKFNSLALAGAAGGGDAAVSGSVVIDVFSFDTEAYVADGAQLNQAAGYNAALGGYTGKGSGQSITVTAQDDTHLVNVAGGIAATLGDAGVGIGLIVDVIHKNVSARIGQSVSASAGGDVQVGASSSEKFFGLAVQLSASTGGAGVAGSVIVVVLDQSGSNGTRAAIGQNSSVHALGNLAVTASDTADKIEMYAGQVAIGLDSAGVGVSASILVRTSVVDAGIGAGDSIQAKSENGASSLAPGLTVSATQGENLFILAVGGSGGGDAGVAGSVTVDVLNDTTTAHVDPGVSVNADNTGAGSSEGMTVAATDNTTVNGIAGALAIGGTAGVGVGVDVEVLTKDTEAKFLDNSSANLLGNVAVTANSSESVLSISAGASVGGSAGVTVNAGVSVFNISTKAWLGKSVNVDANGSGNVAAGEATDLSVIAGNLSVSGSASIGAAVAVPVVTKDTEAWIDQSAQVNARGNGTPISAANGSFVVSVQDTRFDPNATGVITADPSNSSVNDVINLPYNAGFTEGEQVIYYNGISAKDSSGKPLPAQGSIGGLLDGGVYYVHLLPSAPNTTSFQLKYIKNPISLEGPRSVPQLLTLHNNDGTVTNFSFDAAQVTSNEISYGGGLNSGDRVTYSAGGGAALTGLTDGGTYYAISVDATHLKLASSKCNATGLASDCGGIPGTVTPTAIAPAAVPQKLTRNNSDGTTTDFTFDESKVSNDVITMDGAGLNVGDQVVYHRLGTAPLNGLTDGATYYVIAGSDATHIQLARNPQDTQDEVFTLDKSTAQGRAHRIVPVTAATTPGMTSKVFSPSQDVTGCNGPRTVCTTISLPYTLTRSDGSALQTGDAVKYFAGGGTAIGGLTDNTTYYAIVGSGGLRLASSKCFATGSGTYDPTPNDSNTSDDSTACAVTPISLNASAATGDQHSLILDGAVPQPTATDLVGLRTAAPGVNTSFRGLAVTATNRDDYNAIGISGGAAGSVAVNIGGAVNVESVKTFAFIAQNAKINATNNGTAAIGQSVDVVAASEYHELGIAGALAIAGSVSVAPGADVRVGNINTDAHIDWTDQVLALNDVIVSASANEKIISVAAGIAGGGSVGVGGAVSVNVLNTNTYAYIDSPSWSNTLPYAIGQIVTGSDGKHYIALTSTTGVDPTTDSGTNWQLDTTSGSVTANNNLLVGASDDTSVTAVAGSLGIGIAGAGIGASVGVTTISKNTEAWIGSGMRVDAKGAGSDTLASVPDGTITDSGFGYAAGYQGLAVDAASTERLFGVDVSGGGGFVGVAGGIGVEVIKATTIAYIGDGALINTDRTGVGAQSVTVAAVDDAKAFVLAGGLAGGFVGIGGAVDVGVMENSQQAWIGSNAEVHSSGDTNIFALSKKSVTTAAISVGGGFVGVAGSVSVWTIGADAKSSYNDGTQGSAPVWQSTGSKTCTDKPGPFVYCGPDPKTGFKGDLVTGSDGYQYQAKTDITSVTNLDPTAHSGASENIWGQVSGDALNSVQKWDGTKANDTCGQLYCTGTVVQGSDGKYYKATQDNSVNPIGDATHTYWQLTSGTALGDANQSGSGGDPNNGYQKMLTAGGTGPASGSCNPGDTADRVVCNTQTASSAIANNSPSAHFAENAFTLARAPPAGTRAWIKGGANVYAGGSVNVIAAEVLSYLGIAGTVQGGFVAVGGSVLVVNLNSHTDAAIKSGTPLHPTIVSAGTGSGDNITVHAGLDSNGHGIGFTGGGGFVAVGAQVSVLNDSSTQSAAIENGVQIPQAGGTVYVTAHGNRTLRSESIGIQGGAVAVGAAIAVLNVGGSTEATVGSALIGQVSGKTVGGVDVATDSTIHAPSITIIVSGGAVAANAGVAIVTVNPTIEADLGSNAYVTVSGALNVSSSSTIDGPVLIIGAVLGAVAIGADVGIFNVEPTITTEIGPGGHITAGGAVTVTTSLNHTVDATAISVAAGGVTFSGLFIEAQNSTQATNFIGDGSSVSGSSVSVTGTATDETSAPLDQIAAAGVGVSGVGAIASDTTSLDVYIGPAFSVSAADPSHPATVTATGAGGDTGGVTVSVSLTGPVVATVLQLSVTAAFSGALMINEVTADQSARAFLGDKAVINAGSNPVNVTGVGIASAVADGMGISAALGGVAVGGAFVSAELKPTLGAFSTGGGSITGGNVTFSTRLNVAGVDTTDGTGTPVKPTYAPVGTLGLGSPVTAEPAYAHIILGAAGLLAGIAAGDVKATYSPTVTTGPAGTTGMTATGTVAVLSAAYQHVVGDGLSAGLALGASIGFALVHVTAGGSYTTSLGSVNTGASSVLVKTKVDVAGTATGRAIAVAVGGSAVAGFIGATVNPTISSAIGGTARASGNIEVATIVNSTASATSKAFAVGLAGAVGINDVEATLSPTISATAYGAISSGGDVVLRALNNFTGTVYNPGGPLSDSWNNSNGAFAETTQTSVSAGLAVGAAAITATDNTSAAAGVTGGTVTAAGGNVVIASRSPRRAVPTVDMTSIGLATGAGGILSTLNVGGDVAAYVGNGSTVSAQSVSITSNSYNTETQSLQNFGISGGPDLNLNFAHLVDTSVTEAYIGPAYSGNTPGTGTSGAPTSVTSTGSGGITVSSSGNAQASVTADFTALSVVGAGAITKAVATNNATIRSFLGDYGQVHANSAGPVSFTTTGIVTTIVSSTGISAAVGVGVGVDTITADNEPTIGAYGVRNGTITGGSATFETDVNQNSPATGPAQATVQLGTASLIASVGVTTVTATDSPFVTTGPGSGSISVSGAITLTSNVYEHAVADDSSIAASLGAAVATAQPTATAGGSTTTRMGAVASGSAGTTFTAISNVNASSSATGLSDGIALGVGVSVVDTVATTNPTVSTTIGGSPHESGLIKVEALVISDASAITKAVGIGALGAGAGADATATNTPNVSASLAGGTSDNSDILIAALNNFDLPGGGSVYPLVGANDRFLSSNVGAQSSSKNVNVSLGVSVGTTSVTGVDDSSTAAFVAAGGTVSAPNGTVVIASRTPHVAQPSQSTTSVGLLQFAGEDAEANTGGTNAAYVADGATISSTRGLNISADTQNTTSVSSSSIGISAIGGSGMTSKAKDTSVTEAYIGPTTGTTHNGALSTTSVGVGSGGVIVDALSNAPVTATSHMLSIGLFASGAFTDTEATSNGTARAYLGDQAGVTVTGGGVTFDATGNFTTSADGTGFAASTGFTVAQQTVKSDLEPTVKAFTESGGSLSAGAL